MDVLAVVISLSLLTEWITERFFGTWLTGQAMIVLSAAVGVALCLVFAVDAVSLMGLPSPYGSPYTGEIVTGLIVGAGSDVVHSFFNRVGRTA